MSPPSVISASQTMNTPLSRPPIAIISSPFSSTRSFKIPFRVKNPTLKPYPNRFGISTTHFALSNVSTTQPFISAQFRRPSSRRNHLRKKILEKQQVSSGDLVDYGEKRFRVNENGNSVVEGIGCLAEEERLKLAGESVQLSKLESWAEQYKKDVELWGVGSSPIFTVYEDLGGNVERVLVDEDEIRARGGLEEDLKEVNLRILHARMLAKESERGKSVIARNSTVAKFVTGGGNGLEGVKVFGGKSDKNVEVKELSDVKDSAILQNTDIVEPREESGFVSAIRSFVVHPGLYPKLSKFGVVAFGAMLVLWTIKSVIAVGNRGKSAISEKGKTEEELKLEKADAGKFSVEIVDIPPQAQKVNIRRPKLDRQELLKKMSKKKALTTGNLQSLQSSSSQGTHSTESRNLEGTLSDKRDIAMYSRETEAGSSTFLDKNEKLHSGDGNTEMVDLPNIQDGMFQKAEADFAGQPASLNNREDEIKAEYMDCDSIQTSNSSVDVVSNDSKTMTDNDSLTKEPDELVPVQDKENCVAEAMVGDEADHNASASSMVEPVPEQSAPRKKIRIIKSVKEARDYLSGKSDKQVPLDNHEKILTKGVVTSSFPQSGTPTAHIDFDGATDSCIDFSRNNAALPAMVNSMSILENDIVQSESFVVSQKHHDFGNGSLTGIKNQHPHQNDENALASQPRSFNDKHYNKTGDIESHRDFFHDNAAPVFGVGDSPEGMGGLQPTENGNPDSVIDIGKMQHSVISQGDTFSNLLPEDYGHDCSIVSKCSMAHTGDGDSMQEMKKNGPAEDINPRNTSTSDLDAQRENFPTSETNQAAKPNSVMEPPGPNNNWMEKNFHVLDPVVAKIRDGFRENYLVAQEKTEEVGTISDLSELQSIDDNDELDWMKDDHLRDIVFKVRDNELSGREPFHLMSNEDKDAFFGGLQKKVEQENQKLLKVHEYIHSNVENLNYGADGISIYDPPEKVIPRWKGPPPIEKAPDFLSKSIEQKDTMVNSNLKNPPLEKSRATSPLKVENGAPKKPNTIIEGSDGSVKPGKKNGKEFWQHTKKWSQGFLELYNAETDPEMKATMKDIGKDLDRWITEKEIQEAAELIEKMPERNKQFIQKKVEKIKREMELFGPQAVVSKYKEYSEEKEEDYLWWLDLPYILCIEMYTNEGEEQRVGFYSLEMATDLELEPKPCHVIAFEDSKDCKNMCYIIQAHLEMLGSGLAFVIARPPKDTFRESKANGFNVTVIRKGELTLNIDQMLEEVEEQIVEIGSKMYHDQIMKDRSVDMNALMKGVIGDTKPIKRKRARRKLKKSPTNIQ